MTPETKIKKLVTAELVKAGAYHYMPVPGGYGKSTVDYLGSHRGKFFAIETKGKVGTAVTPRQWFALQAMIKAGGNVFVVTCVYDVVVLSNWLAFPEVEQFVYIEHAKPLSVENL